MSAPDIYDMLTQMLQLFRCKLQAMRQINHRMAFQYFQEKDFNDTRVELAQMFHEQLKMMPQLNEMATENKNINTILYRFFSRIIEIVQGEKSKSRTAAYNTHYDYLSQMEGLIYQAVATRQTDHIDTLFNLYEKSHKYAAGTLLSCLDRKMRSVMPKEPIPFKIQTPLRIYSTSLEIPSPLKPSSSLDESPTKKSNPPKVMEALKVLDCLDIDQSTFRSVYLYCKHHSQVVDDEIMERNTDILKEINSYKRVYSDYLARKVRRTSYVKTRKDQTGIDAETDGPLQSLPQSITPSRRAQKNRNQKQYTSLRRLNPQIQRAPSKQNSTGMLEMPQCKYTWDECKSPKRGLSPKKVLISFRKLALKPADMEARATLNSNQSKKKNKMRLSNRRLRQSFDMLIEGQKIKDRDLRRTQYRLFHDKNLTSNLFST